VSNTDAGRSSERFTEHSIVNGNEISDEKSPLQTVILHHSENFTSKKYVEIADIVQDLLIVEITMKLNK
jgi:hypothetical protein